MLLKAFSSNLRRSIFGCSPFHGVSDQIFSITKTTLLQKSPNATTLLNRSMSQYSSENTASNVSKQNSGKKNKTVLNQSEVELSQHEIDSLNQDPDNFGTLSSFRQKSLAVNNTQNESPLPDANDVESTEQPTAKEQTIQYYEATMKDLFEKGHVLEAIELFETEVLQKNQMHAPIRLYKWLIEECIRLHEFNKAIDIYDQMVGRKLTVPFDIFEKLIVAFEQSNMTVGKLNSIQKLMAKKHVQANAKMYNAMVRTYARSTQWKTALTLADEMKAKRVVYEMNTVDALFECFSHDKDNGFYRLIELWHDIHRIEYTPNVSTFNSFLKCVKKCELNNVDKLQQLLETIRMQCTSHQNETEIQDGRPNLLRNPPYIGYLFPLEQVQCPEHRLLILGGLSGLLHEFNKYNITPTLETVAALLEVVPNTFVAHQKVIGLFNKHHIKPNLQIFNILLTKNCHTQNFQNAMEIIEMMCAADLEVDLVSYGLLALSCTNKNDAQEFFDVLASKNVAMDVDILNAMLKNACALKDNDFVISILRTMKSKRIEPTEESIRMVDEYYTRVFRSLRTHRVVSKKMRNECFKLSRECRHWKKYFRYDNSKEFQSKNHAPSKRSEHVKERNNSTEDIKAKKQDKIGLNAVA